MSMERRRPEVWCGRRDSDRKRRRWRSVLAARVEATPAPSGGRLRRDTQRCDRRANTSVLAVAARKTSLQRGSFLHRKQQSNRHRRLDVSIGWEREMFNHKKEEITHEQRRNGENETRGYL